MDPLATIFGEVGFDVDLGRFKAPDLPFQEGDLRFDAASTSLQRMSAVGVWEALGAPEVAEAGAFEGEGTTLIIHGDTASCWYTKMAVGLAPGSEVHHHDLGALRDAMASIRKAHPCVPGEHGTFPVVIQRQADGSETFVGGYTELAFMRGG